MASLTAETARAALRHRDFAGLKARLGACPRTLARLWPDLTALERAACWRLLPASALPAAARALPKAARWQAYLSQPLGCLAPLLEDAPPASRRLFRPPTGREAALLRPGLA